MWSCARHHERQHRREGEQKSHPGSPSCGLPMTIRGGGDPALNPWLPSRCEEWARRPGALPPMRMTASWFRSARIDRIQGCGAISAPDGELPSELSSFAHCRRARPSNVACRRARDRQGQVASRWPAATLDRHCARRPIKLRSGRGDGRQVGRTRRWKRLKISLTVIAPYKGFGCRPVETER